MSSLTWDSPQLVPLTIVLPASLLCRPQLLHWVHAARGKPSSPARPS